MMSTTDIRKERMINELIILEKLSHQNIIKTYEILHDISNFYIVQELIETGDLNQFVSRLNGENGKKKKL